MKNALQITFIALFGMGCMTTNRVLQVPDKSLLDIKQDQEEYELIVLDPGFETWFLTTWSPAQDRSIEYYALWNQRYVTEWNYKATQPRSSIFFDNMIYYDPNIKYGIEVERKLYYYFRWVDTKLGIPILDTRPPGGII